MTARALAALFDVLLDRGGSDLHLGVGYPPMLRVRGDLLPEGDRVLTAADVDALLAPLLSRDQAAQFAATGDLDFAHAHGTRARFRANYLRKITGPGAVFRAIPSEILSLDALNVPAGIRKLAELRAGLVLVTGPTGSGKSTTLAAMIDHINRTRAGHILTIEDPVEFVHPPRRCLVTHKEVGDHVPSFLEAIRSAGRENADVILVGELRGAETMKAALQLASFGILIYATVHTNSAAATIDRFVNAFPADQQPQIRGLLADSLAGVVAQQLLRRADARGRVAAHEILLGNYALSSLIREAKTSQIASFIQSSTGEGMQSMDAALERLVAAGTISARDAMDKALDKEAFARLPSIARALGPEAALTT
ncbi:MAG TPA: PilT/PilU family type 4a pilus ATPase [Kofleriaceae bacterium]